MGAARATAIWALFALVLAVPLFAAATSPLLAWRDPIYVAAGYAGVVALCLTFVQPLLAGGHLPGLNAPRGRRIHRLTGAALITSVVIHVAGLWITSPPDVIDALTFTSPTPFSNWGVIAMWAVFAAGLLAGFRKRLRLRPGTWRIAHLCLALVIVSGGVVHALLIQGTMETLSKTLLCLLVLAASARVIAARLIPTKRRPRP